MDIVPQLTDPFFLNTVLYTSKAFPFTLSLMKTPPPISRPVFPAVSVSLPSRGLGVVSSELWDETAKQESVSPSP